MFIKNYKKKMVHNLLIPCRIFKFDILIEKLVENSLIWGC